MGSLHDGGQVEARPDADNAAITVTDPRFPTTLVHVRDSLAAVPEGLAELAAAYLQDEGRQPVRIVTPVRVRGRIVHRGGDVTYALLRGPGALVPTWSARTGSPQLVPERQVAWL